MSAIESQNRFMAYAEHNCNIKVLKATSRIKAIGEMPGGEEGLLNDGKAILVFSRDLVTPFKNEVDQNDLLKSRCNFNKKAVFFKKGIERTLDEIDFTIDVLMASNALKKQLSTRIYFNCNLCGNFFSSLENRKGKQIGRNLVVYHDKCVRKTKKKIFKLYKLYNIRDLNDPNKEISQFIVLGKVYPPRYKISNKTMKKIINYTRIININRSYSVKNLKNVEKSPLIEKTPKTITIEIEPNCKNEEETPLIEKTSNYETVSEVRKGESEIEIKMQPENSKTKKNKSKNDSVEEFETSVDVANQRHLDGFEPLTTSSLPVKLNGNTSKDRNKKGPKIQKKLKKSNKNPQKASKRKEDIQETGENFFGKYLPKNASVRSKRLFLRNLMKEQFKKTTSNATLKFSKTKKNRRQRDKNFIKRKPFDLKIKEEGILNGEKLLFINEKRKMNPNFGVFYAEAEECLDKTLPKKAKVVKQTDCEGETLESTGEETAKFCRENDKTRKKKIHSDRINAEKGETTEKIGEIDVRSQIKNREISDDGFETEGEQEKPWRKCSEIFENEERNREISLEAVKGKKSSKVNGFNPKKEGKNIENFIKNSENRVKDGKNENCTDVLKNEVKRGIPGKRRERKTSRPKRSDKVMCDFKKDTERFDSESSKENASIKTYRRKRSSFVRWSLEEEIALRDCVIHQSAESNTISWKAVLAMMPPRFKNRTSKKLRNKWRKLLGRPDFTPKVDLIRLQKRRKKDQSENPNGEAGIFSDFSNINQNDSVTEAPKLLNEKTLPEQLKGFEFCNSLINDWISEFQRTANKIVPDSDYLAEFFSRNRATRIEDIYGKTHDGEHTANSSRDPSIPPEGSQNSHSVNDVVKEEKMLSKLDLPQSAIKSNYSPNRAKIAKSFEILKRNEISKTVKTDQNTRRNKGPNCHKAAAKPLCESKRGHNLESMKVSDNRKSASNVNLAMVKIPDLESLNKKETPQKKFFRTQNDFYRNLRPIFTKNSFQNNRYNETRSSLQSSATPFYCQKHPLGRFLNKATSGHSASNTSSSASNLQPVQNTPFCKANFGLHAPLGLQKGIPANKPSSTGTQVNESAADKKCRPLIGSTMVANSGYQRDYFNLMRYRRKLYGLPRYCSLFSPFRFALLTSKKAPRLDMGNDICLEQLTSEQLKTLFKALKYNITFKRRRIEEEQHQLEEQRIKVSGFNVEFSTRRRALEALLAALDEKERQRERNLWELQKLQMELRQLHKARELKDIG